MRHLRIKPIFAWYDMWIGAYWDSDGSLYVFPIPMFGLRLMFHHRDGCPRIEGCWCGYDA